MRATITRIQTNGFAMVIYLLLTTGNLFGQSKGAIRGTVADASSGEFLPGAHVLLEGTKYQTITNVDGIYLLNNVDPGDYNPLVSYLGYERHSQTVAVPATGGEIVVEIKMTGASELMLLQEVTVVGNRFGQAKALNQQKESDNIKNVISQEQIERFPDLNTAEVLQRVPGVTIQRSNGEGRFIALRGTSPTLTNVTVNGEQIAVSNGSQRVVELDVINANQLGGIEVTKVVTPDMDGNAIGGSVNLKNKSAFEYASRVLAVRADVGQNGQSSDLGFRTAIDFSDKFGAKDNIGITLGANFVRTARESHSSENRWGDRDDVNDNELPLVWRDNELKESVNERDRLGLSGQFEYKFNDNHQVYVNAMFNKRWDDQTRNQLRARIDRGDYITRTEVEGARFIKSFQDRIEEQIVTAYNLGGEHQFTGFKMDYKFSYSNAYTRKDDGQIVPEFEFRGVDLLLNEVTSKTPNYQVTNDENIFDGANYVFDQTDFRFENTNNDVYTAALNFALPMNMGKGFGEFKFGGKFRGNNKDRKDTRARWKWEGSDDLLGSQFISSRIIDDFLDTYSLGPAFDAPGFRNFFLANQTTGGFEMQDRPDVNFGEPYDAEEGVTGVYVMGTQTFGNLLVLAGIRAEFISLDYTGTNLVLDDGDFVSASESSFDRSYEFLYPNLQFRYRTSPNTNIRLAFTRGIAPPNFFDLVPYSITDIEGEFVVRGNGNLDPTTSNNYDFLVEHFFEGIGILSGGVFYKDLDKFIFTSFGQIQGGEFDGFDLEEPINGAGARLLGVELSWQQQFTFLPGILSGFGIFANYTYTRSSDIDLGPGVERDDIDVLPFQMEHVGNLALNYERGGLNARIAANFSGQFIEEVGSSSDLDEWRDGFTQWDFSASQRFMKKFDVFFEWNNIFNQGLYNYIGVTTRSRSYEINGSTINLGLKWSL